DHGARPGTRDSAGNSRQDLQPVLHHEKGWQRDWTRDGLPGSPIAQREPGVHFPRRDRNHFLLAFPACGWGVEERTSRRSSGRIGEHSMNVLRWVATLTVCVALALLPGCAKKNPTVVAAQQPPAPQATPTPEETQTPTPETQTQSQGTPPPEQTPT